MKNRIISLPAGFRDVLTREARARRTVETSCAAILEEGGYGEVAPSAVEFLEVYSRGRQGVRDTSFKFLDRDDNLLALRADYTPAIARMISAGLLGPDRPVRVWYSGSVFRKADLNRGNFHEFRQVGAELIGVNSAKSDVEVIDLALRCLEAAGVTDVQVHLNHTGIFGGVINMLGLTGQQLGLITTEIDRKDTRGVTARLNTLGVDSAIERQLTLLSRSIGGEEVLRKVRDVVKNEESQAAVAHLLELAACLGTWRDRLVFDLTEIDEMEYYTGFMMKLLSPRSRGELGGGGRYDTLMQEFGAAEPAVGFSLSIDRLVELT